MDGLNAIMRFVQRTLLHGEATSAAAQMIRYPETSGRSKYTFSIWAFPEEEYPDVLRGYFEFCRDYERKYRWRCDMLNVGYRIAEDQGSLFSYSYSGTVMTLDPVATGDHGWDESLRAYNDYCSKKGGVPLFNQTKWITPQQACVAFGDRIGRFRAYVERYDPEQRLLSSYFRERFFQEC